MAGVLGRLLGRPGPAEPLGEQDWPTVIAPTSAKAGLRYPERVDISDFQTEVPDPDDEPDEDRLPTERHRRAF